MESAVAIVLVRTPDLSNAITVSLFSEVAHHPTALWISLNKSSYTHSLLLSQPEFSLSVLNQKQASIALACGTVSGRERDKCAALDVFENGSGFLFLKQALAATSCRVRRSEDIGDHTLFVADILETVLESRTSHLRHLLISDLTK